MSKRNEMLKGNLASWKTEEGDEYITNNGYAEIAKGRVIGSCFRLGKTHTGMAMVVKIDNEQFAVIQERRFYPEAELTSAGYQYKNKQLNNLEVWEVLEMLQRDTTTGYAARKVKKELVRLIQKNIKLKSNDKKELDVLLKSWRTPIRSE